MSQLLRTESIEALIAASEDPARRLRRTLGPWSLTALGIGAVIGSGIFILTGTAAALVLTGIADYRTLANAAPVAGALKALGYESIRRWVSLGALAPAR
jgi:hypothetical protein